MKSGYDVSIENLCLLGFSDPQAENILDEAYTLLREACVGDPLKHPAYGHLSIQYLTTILPRMLLKRPDTIGVNQAMKYIQSKVQIPSTVTVITGKPSSGKSTLLRGIDNLPGIYVKDEFWDGHNEDYEDLHDEAAIECLMGSPVVVAGCLTTIAQPDLHLHMIVDKEVRRMRLLKRGGKMDNRRVKNWAVMDLIESILYEPMQIRADYLVKHD